MVVFSVLLFLSGFGSWIRVTAWLVVAPRPPGVPCLPKFSHQQQQHHQATSTRVHAVPTKCNGGTVIVPRTTAAGTGGETTTFFSLSYRIFRPMSLSSRKAAPVVVLHGGPSLPSDYLESLVDVIPYRSIIFYDQLGCGESDEPKDMDAYSIQLAIDDLEILLKKLGVQRFHLYGHSFGGMLAYEYVKRMAEAGNGKDNEGCLSVVLSSAPTSIPLLEGEWNRLLKGLENDANSDESLSGLSPDDRFRRTHICRFPEIPESLARAYQKAGSTWAGLDVVKDYACQQPPPRSTTRRRMPSALILRGQYDFCTEPCVRDWDALLQHKFVRHKILEGCSHHALLERGDLYGDVLEDFFAEYD